MIYRLLSRTRLEEYLKKDDRIILPVGSTEQHGPYGLTGTDHLIAEKLAERIAELTFTIAGPTLPFGMSLHHTEFKGVLTLKPSTLFKVFEDIFWSLHKQGFKRIMIINGHGGNRNTFGALMSEYLYQYTDMKVKFRSWWDGQGIRELIDDKYGDREGKHCTPSEISLTMYLYPEYLKKTETAFNPLPERTVFEDPVQFKAKFPDGIVGADPNLATAEHGKEIFEKCAESFISEMNYWGD
ncbi:MAG: creatininase family protein [bacterium]|nr:creatininase family protein [bacterium]